MSPTGTHVLIPDPGNRRFLVWTLGAQPDCVEVGETLTGGVMARWSADGQQVVFKIVHEMVIFADGFETGDTSQWDLQAP
jgi:hypothetical protein